MEGVVELAEEIFHMPVRIGAPSRVKGLTDIVRNPIYSTAVGLLEYGAVHSRQSNARSRSAQSNGPGMFTKMKDWIQSNF